MLKGFQGSLNTSVADVLRRSRESRQNSSISKENLSKFKFSEANSVNRVPAIQTERREFSRSRVERGSI